MKKCILLALFLSLGFSAEAQTVKHTAKEPNFFVPENVLQQVQTPEKKSPSDILCQQHCGHGYFYNKRSTPEKIVCARYPRNCGKRCEIMSSTNSDYTDPIQCIDFLIANFHTKDYEPSDTFARLSAGKPKIAYKKCDGLCQSPNGVKSETDEECEHVCGECYYFDRDETEYWGGSMTVCTKHPHPNDCSKQDFKTSGWSHDHLLVNGREYQCRYAWKEVPVKENHKGDYIDYLKGLLK